MNTLIEQFIQQQTCATICCTDDEGNPYCFTCFFAFNVNSAVIYFKSSPASYHAALLRNRRLVAGTILPDKLSKLVVKGIQFEGEVLPPDDVLTRQAYSTYHKKHPLALTVQGEMWALQLNRIKMTDSTQGFGKKIAWSRQEEVDINNLQHN